MSVTEVAVNGTPLDLDLVEWEVAIDHGRNDINDAPQAGTCTLTIRGFDAIPCAISDTLTVEAYGAARFTGTVTDLELTHDDNPNGNYVGRLRVQAMGTLSRLGLLNVGAAGYPEETLDDRVNGILTETGLTYTANVDPYMVQLAEDPSEGRAAMDWLSELCQTTGATMCDLPDGSILFESYTRRGIGYNPATWAQVAGTWAVQIGTWANITAPYTTAPVPVSLANTGVIWEPVWRNSVLTIVNDVIVEYDDPVSTMTADDATSIAAHGKRTARLSTRLADTTDAFERAAQVIRSQSEPRYDLQQIQVAVDQLSNAERTAVLGLIQGSRVQLADLPQPAPYFGYLGVVEGWSESYTPSGHTLTLSLSDPRYSYAMALWSQIDPALTWAGVDSTVAWYDVVLPTDLAA